MKELKVSISDKLYEGLSDVGDRDSFVAALLEKELERAECEAPVSNNSLNNADVECMLAGDAFDIMPVQEDVAEICMSYPDFLNEPGDDGNDASVEKMACFQRAIADMANRIDKLEDKIRDMNIIIFTLKERSSINEDGSGGNGECGSSVSDPIVVTSAPDPAVPDDLEIKLPYATLSFPELKIPPELLPGEEDLPMKEGTFVQDILSSDHLISEPMSPASPEPTPFETLVSLKQDVFTNDIREMDSSSNDLEPPLENLLERSVPPMDNFAYGVEQGLISSKPLPSSTTNVPVTSPFSPSQDHINNNFGVSSVEVPSKAPSAPEDPLPVADRLESCILAYLPFGSEVKKDVIKNLLPKRYTDDDLETKINQLLASGVVSNIVKDGIVHLTRTSKKEAKK
jgi:hypothetical protein